MSDPQDQAERTDDELLGDEFPPDKPPGAQAYGAAGAEPHADESVAARAAREEPDDLGAGESGPVGVDAEGDAHEAEAPTPAEAAALHEVEVDPDQP